MRINNITIEINNLTKEKIPPLVVWFENFLAFSQKYLPGKKFLRGEISIAIIGSQRMKKINKKYRQKESSTDVLSFVYEKKKDYLNGELFFCPKTIAQRAKQYKSTLKKEWQQDFVHGMLHLWGWDHSQKMFFWQEKIQRFLDKKTFYKATK